MTVSTHTYTQLQVALFARKNPRKGKTCYIQYYGIQVSYLARFGTFSSCGDESSVTIMFCHNYAGVPQLIMTVGWVLSSSAKDKAIRKAGYAGRRTRRYKTLKRDTVFVGL